MANTTPLKLLSALLSLAAAGALVGSLFSPEFLLVHDKERGALVDVSAWLGFLQGEMVWRTALKKKPDVMPFDYQPGAFCKDACKTLHQGSIYGTAGLCLAATLLVGASTLALAACPRQAGSPEIGGRAAPPLHPHLALWARHLCAYAVCGVIGGVVAWMLMLQRARDSFSSMGLSTDATVSPGLSFWLVVGALLGTLANAGLLTVTSLSERLHASEAEGQEYRRLPPGDA